MTEREAMDEIRRLMRNPRTTIAQLRKVAKECNREVWWSLKKPERNISVNLSKGTVAKDGAKR